MPDITEDYREAWRQAAADLGFALTMPYAWLTPDSRAMNYIGLVRGFGRRRGVLLRIMSLGEFPGLTPLDDDHLVLKMGSTFVRYDRDLWLATLRDWGWAGMGECPVEALR
jgi:hypothetical protein